jgi:hypothetical protein
MNDFEFLVLYTCCMAMPTLIFFVSSVVAKLKNGAYRNASKTLDVIGLLSIPAAFLFFTSIIALGAGVDPSPID